MIGRILRLRWIRRVRRAWRIMLLDRAIRAYPRRGVSKALAWVKELDD